MDGYEFRWLAYLCADGHVVALGQMWYRPGEEPIVQEPEHVPDWCPKCNAPVRPRPELRLRDQVGLASIENPA